MLNILYGESDPRYGDQDEDGVVTNPGDGYDLLVDSDELAVTIDLLNGITDQLLANAIVGFADHILNGEDLNDNDMIEPIAGEGARIWPISIANM